MTQFDAIDFRIANAMERVGLAWSELALAREERWTQAARARTECCNVPHLAGQPNIDATEAPADLNNAPCLAEQLTSDPHNAAASQVIPKDAVQSTAEPIAKHCSAAQPSSATPVLPRFRIPFKKEYHGDGPSKSTYIDKRHYDAPNRPFAQKYPEIFYGTVTEYSVVAKPVQPHPNAPEKVDASTPVCQDEKKVNLDSRKLGTASDHTDYRTVCIAEDQNADVHTLMDPHEERNGGGTDSEAPGLKSIIANPSCSLIGQQRLGFDVKPASGDAQTADTQTELQPLKRKGEEKLRPHTAYSYCGNGGRQNGEESRTGAGIRTPSPKKSPQAAPLIGGIKNLTPGTNSQQFSPFNGGGLGQGNGHKQRGGMPIRGDRGYRGNTPFVAVNPNQMSPFNSSWRSPRRGSKERDGNLSGQKSSNTTYVAVNPMHTSPIGARSRSLAKALTTRAKQISSPPKERISPAIPRNFTSGAQRGVTFSNGTNGAGNKKATVRNATSKGAGLSQTRALSLPRSTNMTGMGNATEDLNKESKKSAPSPVRVTKSFGTPATEPKKPVVQVTTQDVKRPSTSLMIVQSKTETKKTEREIDPTAAAVAEKAKETWKSTTLAAETITRNTSIRETSDVPSIGMARKTPKQTESAVKDSTKAKTPVSTLEKEKESGNRSEVKSGDGEEDGPTQVPSPNSSPSPEEKKLSKAARKRQNRRQREAEEKERERKEAADIEAAIASNSTPMAPEDEDRRGDTAGGDEGESISNYVV
jgi:hypothetical protein